MSGVWCRDTVVSRSGRDILGPVSLELPDGGLVGVVGPNGAGKTTLLRVIAGLERPDGGTVANTVRTAVLLQHHAVLEHLPLTVWDVVAFGRLGTWRPGRGLTSEDHRAVDGALSTLGLAGFDRRLYRELSGGERRKVQLARCLAQEPRLMLLDEPGAGLDLEWQERLTATVGDLSVRPGVTVVMVSHEINRLPSGCRRIILLREGRIVADGSPSDVLRDDVLSGTYGVRMEVTRRNGRFFAAAVGVAA